jgi:DNA-binding response OmpR family regulator
MSDQGRILLADPNELFRESTTALLMEAGFVCTQATDRSSAQRHLEIGTFDLAICDVTMAGDESLDLVQWIRARPQPPGVLLVTGLGRLDSAMAAMRLGVRDYMLKPVEPAELLERVRDAVQAARAANLVGAMRRRLDEWSADARRLEQFWAGGGGDEEITVQGYLELTLRGVMTSLLDLKELTESLATRRDVRSPCHLLECGRLDSLNSVLRETVDVLETTKGSFKSRALGQLRQKLQRALARR